MALAALGGLFPVESVVAGSDYEWLGGLAPMRYYDPTAVLVDGEYDLAGAAVLLVAVLALVAGSVAYFSRTDVD